MRRLFLAICPLLLSINARAQLELDLVTEQKQFLPGEELRIGVRIGNVSGQTLKFGEGKDWVNFQFDPNGKIRVNQIADIPAIEPFRVTNSTRVTRWFDIAPYFDVVNPGYYSLNAVVQVKDWKEERATRAVKLEIINPSTIWEQTFGVPPKPGAAAGPPEIRKYLLQRARIQDENRLYVRVTDASETKVFRVMAIDRLLELNDPISQLIDQHSQLHVLHRTGRTSYNYSVFDPDGETLIRQRHDYNELTGSRPTLRTTESGQVIVFGGVRKLTSVDVPPSERDLQK